MGKAKSTNLTATFDRELAGTSGNVPDWVHLLPLGEIKGRDGREFLLESPQVVVEAFNTAAVDLAVDYEHQSAKPAVGPVPAAGWIKELVATATGIWGRVEWTAKARQMIGAKEYRYVSPEIEYRQENRQITRLRAAGMVHRPNLHLTALAAQEDNMHANPDTDDDKSSTFIERFAVALGLPPQADADTILAALEKLLTRAQSPDPKKFVPVEAMAELLADRNARVATFTEETATRKVDDAFKRGYLTAAMKPWATALCRDDPAAFDEFMKTSAPAYAHLQKHSVSFNRPTFSAERHEGTQADDICAQLGLPLGSIKD